MKNEKLFEFLGDIDEAYVEQAGAERKKTVALAWISGMAAACFLLMCAAVCFMSAWANEPNQAGGLNGKINTRDPIVITGEEYVISDAEAFAYLESVKNSIQNTLCASGIPVSSLTVKENGYSHVRTGDGGNTLAVNWRDYLAYDGDRLVAIISVTRDGEGMKHHLSFGGEWFSSYAELLTRHEGKALAYLYIGDVEAFVLPDHSVVSVMGVDISSALENNMSYYEYFATEYNVYIP